MNGHPMQFPVNSSGLLSISSFLDLSSSTFQLHHTKRPFKNWASLLQSQTAKCEGSSTASVSGACILLFLYKSVSTKAYHQSEVFDADRSLGGSRTYTRVEAHDINVRILSPKDLEEPQRCELGRVVCRGHLLEVKRNLDAASAD